MTGHSPPPPPLSLASWILFRLAPSTLLVLAAGLLSGFFRTFQFFPAGLQGMVVGGLIGYVAGRIARGDRGGFSSFPLRAWASLSFGFAFVFVSIVTASILNAGPGDAPLSWILDVVDGSRKELFFSAGRHSAVAGRIDGAWWLLFNLLDACLFAFLCLAFMVVGFFPDNDAERDGENESSEVDAAPDGATVSPTTLFPAESFPGGLTGCVLFAGTFLLAASFTTVLLLLGWMVGA